MFFGRISLGNHQGSADMRVHGLSASVFMFAGTVENRRSFGVKAVDPEKDESIRSGPKVHDPWVKADDLCGTKRTIFEPKRTILEG